MTPLEGTLRGLDLHRLHFWLNEPIQRSTREERFVIRCCPVNARSGSRCSFEVGLLIVGSQKFSDLRPGQDSLLASLSDWAFGELPDDI